MSRAARNLRTVMNQRAPQPWRQRDYAFVGLMVGVIYALATAPGSLGCLILLLVLAAAIAIAVVTVIAVKFWWFCFFLISIYTLTHYLHYHKAKLKATTRPETRR